MDDIHQQNHIHQFVQNEDVHCHWYNTDAVRTHA